MIYSEFYPVIRAKLNLERQQELFRKAIKFDYVSNSMPSDENNSPRKITGVDLTDRGFRTYVEGEKFPVRFYVPAQTVNVAATYKRLFSLLATKPLGLLAIVLLKDVWIKWLEKVFTLNPVLFKDEYWSEPVKEIRRILHINKTIKDAVSVVINHDMSYCYIMQDLLSEIDKDAFEKNYIKEIKRIINIAYSRYHGGVRIIEEIKKYLPVLLFVTRFMPKTKRFMKQFVRDLDKDKIRLSEEDIYWTDMRHQWDFRGIPYEKRYQEYLLLKNS